jgi:branched-chain amino acid aminotransferase
VVRLGKIEGRDRGYEEMILLNEHGRVAEAFGSCVLMVRDGRVVTPPAWEGALESITVDLLEALCVEMSIPFERRPIDRTELLIADEVALAGTLVELTVVRSIDGLQMPSDTIVTALQRRYLSAVCGLEPHAATEMSTKPCIGFSKAAENAGANAAKPRKAPSRHNLIDERDRL